MGMTIEESKEWLVSRKEHYELDDNCQELAQALDVAIETMCKYQKIEKIIRNYDTTWEFHHMKDTIDKIREVLENGKID